MFKKISIFIFAALILLCGCKTDLSNYFFDEDVLKYYNISGLVKPENVEIEEWYYDAYNHYTCKMKGYEEFQDYAKKAFDLLNKNGYSIVRQLGNHKTTGEYFTSVIWYEAEISDNFEDYLTHSENEKFESYTYSFFYTSKGFGKETSTPDGKNRGKPMKNAYKFALAYFKKGIDLTYNTSMILVEYEENEIYVLNA